MADDVQFVNGLIVKAPREGAPSFVKMSIGIKVAELGLWLRERHKAGEEWVNVDVKESKGGKWYAAVNTFKPEAKQEPKQEPRAAQKTGNTFADMSDDIPF